MRIEQKDKGVYKCSISLLGIIDSRLNFITVKLKRDDLTPKIAEPIQVVYEGGEDNNYYNHECSYVNQKY